VQGLHDVSHEPNQYYTANDYEQLLEVYRQNLTEVTLGAFIWQRTTGMTGPSGLTALPSGGYELVFDAATGAGLRTVTPATVANIGAGCAGAGGATPAISATGTPVLGTSFSIDLTNALPNSFGIAAVSTGRLDIPLGNGCTLYPQQPGATALALTSGAGTASLSLGIPNNVALLGAALYAQWFVIDAAGAFGPNIASLSDGLVAAVGDV
jgi:hypothetical protein